NKKGPNGRRVFEEVGHRPDVGIGIKPKSGMSASLGDIDNSSQLSIYITNISDPGNLMQGNWLWVPQSQEKDKAPSYQDESNQRGVQYGGWSWGAQFGDLNNDGRLDLFLTNGYISADRKEDYWFEYGLIAGGHKLIIGDCRNWPAIKGRSLSGYQQKR